MSTGLALTELPITSIVRGDYTGSALVRTTDDIVFQSHRHAKETATMQQGASILNVPRTTLYEVR